MACGGVKSQETGKISCEAHQSEMKINVNLLNFAVCSLFILCYNLIVAEIAQLVEQRPRNA